MKQQSFKKIIKGGENQQVELKNVPENVPEKRLKKIVEFVTNNNKITTSALAEKLQVNQKTIKRDIQKLKKEKILYRIGGDKGGKWELKR